jgi:hypothetical protein
MYYKYNADVVDGSRIDILDEGALPSTSTMDTLVSGIRKNLGNRFP